MHFARTHSAAVVAVPDRRSALLRRREREVLIRGRHSPLPIVDCGAKLPACLMIMNTTTTHHDHHVMARPHHGRSSRDAATGRALETILTEKGYIEPAALDAIIEAYETKIGPHNGARVVAKAWVDPDYKARLLADATDAANALGYIARVGDHLVAVENTPRLHNLVVCTLCSCYPWEVLGLPPVWYNRAVPRARREAPLGC